MNLSIAQSTSCEVYSYELRRIHGGNQSISIDRTLNVPHSAQVANIIGTELGIHSQPA